MAKKAQIKRKTLDKNFGRYGSGKSDLSVNRKKYIREKHK